ncbi:sensor histidine kinase [Janthinobacterium sp.]|uniref:histidine kinase n=1 Tax=Janthinobacterium sp. TaxID=1871054 RepID=UPI002635A146|nr:sensor histidine kinase [Janthinobacterium sp.]
MPTLSLIVNCLLLCCLALPTSAMARSLSMSLDDGWRACDSTLPTASLHQLLKPQQLRCLERELILPATPQSPQVLLLSALAASTLWLDSVQIASNGQPAAQAADEIAGQVDMAVPLAPAQLAQGAHHLRLLLSTQQVPARLEPPFYGFSLQDQQAYQTAQAWRNLPPLLLAGALAGAAVLLTALKLALNLLYQRRLHWAIFTALCLAASLLLVAETWRSLAGYAYPQHIVRLYAINLLTWLFAALLPLYFFCAYHFRHSLLAAALMLGCVALAGALPVHFDNQCRMMFVSGLAASLAINLFALWRRLPGSRTSTAIALLSCVMYMLAGNGFAEGGFALVVCFLLLPLCAQLLSQLMRDRQKAARASQLENQLLRKNLQPHFLMNSLSLISELNEQSPQAAENFIVALGDGFRMLNEYAQQPSIALTQELALCHNYLAIMSTRLQQPCKLELIGETRAIIVPPATLLTALENAFSHNRYRQGATFRLQIERNSQTDILSLLLPAGETRPHAGTGIGERYIHSSLQAVFGKHAHYETTLAPNGRQLRFTLPVAS